VQKELGEGLGERERGNWGRMRELEARERTWNDGGMPDKQDNGWQGQDEGRAGEGEVSDKREGERTIR
jgi:hypothetical protein